MPAPSVRPGLVGALGAAVCALAVLGALSQIYDTEHLYVEGHSIGLNDQAGYISTARWLADTGELRSHLIYPAYSTEPHWRLYMPGQYYVLAAAYGVFGDHPLAWRAPGMISFVVAAMGIFLIGRRLFGQASGAIAAVLFIALPANGLFAFTAMPQLPFIACTVLSFCTFVHLPERSRVLWIPILLIPPFLMRETGALMLIPMLFLAMRGGRFGPLASAAIAAGGSVLCLSAVLAIQIASGKGALPLSWALSGSFNYTNAFPPSFAPSAADWISGLTHNLGRNFQAFVTNTEARWQNVEPVFALVALSIIGLFNPKEKRLALSAAALVLTVAGMISILYDWSYYRGTRSLLFTYPLCTVAAAPVLLGWISGVRDRLANGPMSGVKTILPWGAALLVVILWSIRGSLSIPNSLNSEYGARAIARLETIEIQQDKLFVAPFEISLDYVLAHYPIRWSFVPANAKTLRLLDSTHAIGTFIIRRDQLTSNKFQMLSSLGFSIRDSFRFKIRTGVATYWVFQRESQK